MLKKSLFTILALLLLMALLVWYLPEKTQRQATCLQEIDGCSIYYRNEPVGRLHFEVTRDSLVQPFDARVTTRDADTVSLEISGINYYMGYNHYSLRKRGDSFVYRGVLPSCIYRNMHWQVTVTITKGNISYTANYDFLIRRDIDGLT